MKNNTKAQSLTICQRSSAKLFIHIILIIKLKRNKQDIYYHMFSICNTISYWIHRIKFLQYNISFLILIWLESQSTVSDHRKGWSKHHYYFNQEWPPSTIWPRSHLLPLVKVRSLSTISTRVKNITTCGFL
jgi:hypothetical protein